MCFATRGGLTKPVSSGIPDAEKEAVNANEAEAPNNPPDPAAGEGVRVTGETSSGPYSIQFEIYDSSEPRKPCAGMYYSLKVSSEETVRNNLVTDANGRTERVFSDNADDRVYLYIGHREEAYADLPTSRSTEDDERDEYNLNNNVADQTLAPHNEMKVAHITTQRLWRPWAPSEEVQTLIKDVIETFSANFYDLGDGGITIGYGHFTPHSRAAAIRAQYPNGITRQQADVLFEDDLVTRARYRALYELIGVPLHQYEFDALVCMRFNIPASTEGTVGFTATAPHTRLRGQTTIRDHLNRGQYTQAGNRIPTIYNSKEGQWSRGVQNRRNCERDIFLQGVYQGW